MRRNGFSLIEVMMALVILGVVITIFFQTSKYANRNQGKTRSWEGETAVIEKTIEGLRVGYSVTQLQQLNQSWIDSSQGGQKYSVKVNGSLPPVAVVTNANLQQMLAQVTVVVKKAGDTDSLVVNNVMWVN